MNCKNLEEKEAGFPVYGFYGGIFSGFVGNDLYHSRNQLRFPVGFPVLRSFDGIAGIYFPSRIIF